ncbi:chromosomal replication initiator protein DnaA [candidate division KSB1 bacterium]|nr:MAG: chromosomal replication initiator protein DnaA [candidate division KSB1 bacterium]
MKEIWQNFLNIIKKNINSQSFRTWFKPMVPVKLEGKELTVQIPSQFFYEWLEEHYSILIKKALKEVIGDNAKLVYSVVMNNNYNLSDYTSRHSKKFLNTPDDDTQLNPRYTFENFVEGASNQFAKAASLAVAEAPGKTNFNPLLVYGGVGLGKTHLIQAIGNFSKQKGKVKKILYVSSEKFTIDFINSISNNKTTEFSSYYRNIDLLLVDDIQFFIDKERTQEEFFHTFNSLHQKGKQIVLTSDRAPKEHKGLEERLLSRFQWGLVVDIQPPDLETRMAILKKKAEEDSFEIPPDVTHFIASQITSNIRELEGALIKLIAYSSLNGKEITLELAKNVLKDIIRYQNKKISIESIQRIVSEYFDIPENILREKTRKQEAVLARQISMYLAKKLTKNTLKTIGLHFGGRDHSTVVHAINEVQAMIEREESIRNSIEILERKIEYS